MTRQEANLKLLELITAEVNSNPDSRFNQILHSLGFIVEHNIPGYPDTQELLDYYEEPVVTYSRVTGK
jgi:hypothetical protein